MKKTATRAQKRRGESKERVNPFDVFAAISLLAVFFVLVLHTKGTDRYAPDTQATVTVTLRDLSAEECRELSEAKTLYSDGVPLYPEGKIPFRNSVRIAFNRSAEPIELYSPERYDCTLTLSVMGANTEEGFFLDGKRFLARGVTISMAADGLTLKGTITDVKREAK